MLSSKAKYGLKALAHLARRTDEKAVLIAEIAEQEMIPKKFLDAILLEIKNAGLLSSKKGKGGGYSFAIPPEKITVGDVVRLLDGPLAPVQCASRTAYKRCADCADERRCAVRRVMLPVRDAIAAILDAVSLADLVAAPDDLEPFLEYDI